MNWRALSGVAVLGLGAWALVSIFTTPQAPAEPVVWESSQQCAQCHTQVYDEWKVSWHAQSYTDPDVRAQTEDFTANKDCIDCHAPQPVFTTVLGERVLPRATRRIEGVDCIACHLMPDGRVAGTLDNPSVACRPIATRDLLKPEYCAGCHNQHGTVDQWRQSKYAQPGPGYQDCVACHMPHRDGDPQKGRDHTMHGGHDIDIVRRAVELRVTRENGAAVVEVENVGAGHNYPTDERSRASDLFWRPLAADGAKGEWRQIHRFRNPYRFEVDLVNTELPAGAKVRFELDAPEARGEIEVALFYKLNPLWADPQRPDPEREAQLVHSRRLAP
ncbi:MAG: hypothetical protein JNN27_02970 [Planctomycetes bacterium]|nr:hypothetical protein [Planctomycetota bacterium]